MSKQPHSQLSKSIMTRYVLSVLAIPLCMMAFFFLAWFLCTRTVWHASNPLYRILKYLQYLAPAIIVVFSLGGFFFFTYRAIHQPLQYLEDMIAAAKALSHPDETPISLSGDLREIENELNLVREQSLRNMAAVRSAEQRKNDLIVYLAHDLKTPLTSVIGYLSLLRDEPDISPELRTKYAAIALDRSYRLEDLLNEFFDITRFNLSTLTLELSHSNLTRMLEQTVSEFDPILAEKSLTWRTEIAPNVQILCDRDKLARVWDNLIRNAVNYSFPGTEVFLAMTAGTDGITVTIRNHGRTIPPQKLERIFDQFYRLDSARSTTTGGAGLGLAISKEIVEVHGGKITAQSQNESITFTVFLPVSHS